MSEILERTVRALQESLADAGCNPRISTSGAGGRFDSNPESARDRLRIYSAKSPIAALNPDEVVAVGAAVQGGVLGGEVKDVLLPTLRLFRSVSETLGGVVHQAH